MIGTAPLIFCCEMGRFCRVPVHICSIGIEEFGSKSKIKGGGYGHGPGRPKTWNTFWRKAQKTKNPVIDHGVFCINYFDRPYLLLILLSQFLVVLGSVFKFFNTAA